MIKTTPFEMVFIIREAMNYEPYLGHESQLWAVEEVRLVGGKGDGMRLLQVRNASGLAFTVCADRCADLYRVIFKGSNMGYFSPSGYVAPAYYDDIGTGFLKSFTAGFLTTCGLTSIGDPCTDQGEELPMHSTVANIPCDRIYWEDTDQEIIITARVNDGQLFGRKLQLNRKLICGKYENYIKIQDTVTNLSDRTDPLSILYHMNMGYPLLSENAVLEIPSVSVRPFDDGGVSAAQIDHWQQMEPPQPHFAEQCFFHTFEKQGMASIYNPDIGKGLRITFETEQLPCLAQWKMMGVRDYVLGLEPGNCTPEPRSIQRRNGKIQFIGPNEKRKFEVIVEFFEK